MFPAHSIELKFAVAVCVLLPYAAIPLICRRNGKWSLTLEQAVFIFLLFVVSFIAIALVTTQLWQHPSGSFAWSFIVLDAMLIAAVFTFPTLPLLIVAFFFALLSWNSDMRLGCLALSGVTHLLYFINVVMFMAGIDLIKI
jgi:hypothetical protein